MFFFPRLAVSLAIALLLMFSGTGLVRASSVALPGDNLYPVKRTWEDVRLMLVFSPESREELEVEFEQERLHEVDELLAEGRHETIKFAGILTQQDGNLWIVSGVPVQITPESRLPGTPVILGTAIVLEGRTNDRGFVEAEYIEILGSNIVLPTGVPTEIKSHEDSANNSSQEENDNGHQSEDEMDSSQDEDQNDNVKKDEIDDNSNSTSGRNEYNNDDYSDDDRSGREHQTDGGGSEGEQDTNDDGGHD